jgi:serine/threonine-protein kinase
MAVTVGTRLGSYELTALLGKGGMGEVYRARDAKLKREVAIKILPDEFSRDPARVSRFQREAEVLASLNHPNIGVIHDLQEADGTRFLVLELVEGSTLAERIQRGRIPFEEALSIAHQMAEACEAAHEKGVIHRDLKPGNVKITPEGKVKVLDFGLAKALDAAPQQAASNSPTILTAATNGGLILGTAGYMSPEQARGHAADQRSDIFSFGCVLYEMLTGRETFSGDTVTDIIASVLAREPDWRALPPDIHPGMEDLIRRCLAKNRKDRWHAIADIRMELERILADPYGSKLRKAAVAGQRPLWRRAIPIAAALIVGMAISAVVYWSMQPPQSTAITRFPIFLPEANVFTTTTRPFFALSPDGANLVYSVNSQLYVRPMAEMEDHPIPGTRFTPINPFFSPDGRWIGFYAQGQIKKIALTGGAAVPICDADLPYGASWSTNEAIFVGQGTKGILRVYPNGGKPETVVSMKPGELAYGPQLLPGGDWLLFTLAKSSLGAATSLTFWDRAQIVVQSLKSGDRKILIEGGSDARYLPTGHLLYALGSSLRAVRFDVRKLQVEAAAAPVLESIMRAAGSTGAAQFSVANNGTMVYVSENSGTDSRLLAIVDRTGVRKPLNLPPGPYLTPRVSPDGKQLTYYTDDGKDRVVWVYELNGATPSRQLTFGRSEHRPIWTRNGKRIVFSSDRAGESGLFWQAADGNGTPERLTKTESPGGSGPQSEMWSPIDNILLFSMSGPFRTLWTVSPGVDEKPKRLMEPATFSVSNGTFSPDGKWIAYFSGELDQNEVFVQAFPLNGTKYRISTGGGFDPVWSRDGKLFYTRGQTIGTRQMMAVDVQTQPSFVFGKTTALPIEGMISTGPRSYDIMPDGKFIVVLSAGSNAGKSPAPQFSVTLNWLEELKQRVPVK